jgi:hypothetical protein
MDKQNINVLAQLLYYTDKINILSHLSKMDNPLMLHFFAANYNWSNGFDIPMAILENKTCDFGTGLLMFHYADGFRMLENPNGETDYSLENWGYFLNKVHHKLVNQQFKSQKISFDSGLTKVQRYKLQKINPDLPELLISQSPGVVVDIPAI